MDEKGRWQESVAEFDGQVINVVGDVIISSGIIAYLGSFTVNDNCLRNQRYLVGLQILHVLLRVH